MRCVARGNPCVPMIAVGSLRNTPTSKPGTGKRKRKAAAVAPVGIVCASGDGDGGVCSS